MTLIRDFDPSYIQNNVMMLNSKVNKQQERLLKLAIAVRDYEANGDIYPPNDQTLPPQLNPLVREVFLEEPSRYQETKNELMLVIPLYETMRSCLINLQNTKCFISLKEEAQEQRRSELEMKATHEFSNYLLVYGYVGEMTLNRSGDPIQVLCAEGYNELRDVSDLDPITLQAFTILLQLAIQEVNSGDVIILDLTSIGSEVKAKCLEAILQKANVEKLTIIKTSDANDRSPGSHILFVYMDNTAISHFSPNYDDIMSD